MIVYQMTYSASCRRMPRSVPYRFAPTVRLFIIVYRLDDQMVGLCNANGKMCKTDKTEIEVVW